MSRYFANEVTIGVVGIKKRLTTCSLINMFLHILLESKYKVFPLSEVCKILQIFKINTVIRLVTCAKLHQHHVFQVQIPPFVGPLYKQTHIVPR